MKATLKDSMGTDLSVVNAARVSFAKESHWLCYCEPKPDGTPTICTEHHKDNCGNLSATDTSLINFLARGMTEKDYGDLVETLMDHSLDWTAPEVEHFLWSFRNQPQHSSPFRHCFATFHVKAPVFVARQLVKHQVGMSWNEVSRRYVDDEPEFWMPTELLRSRSANKKQGSGDALTPEVNAHCVSALSRAVGTCQGIYETLIQQGVAPEMARIILPQNTMTEWIWSGSLQSWAHVCNLRCHPEAQKETRDLCLQIDEECGKLWPVSWAALRNGG